MSATTSTKPDLKQLTMSSGSHCESVSPADLDRCIEEAICEVEAVTGCPWCPTQGYEVIKGDGTRRLQIGAECITCITSVEMSETSKTGPWCAVCYDCDAQDGLTRGGGHCCNSVWPKGCWVLVRYEYGHDGKCSEAHARLIARIAANKAQSCGNDRIKSRTMGSYSETFTDSPATVGGLTDSDLAMLERLADSCRC